MKPYKIPPDIGDKVTWFRRKLKKWFKTNRRSFPWRESGRNHYEILIAEILLRRTRADAAARIYPYFLKKYPDFSSLAKASNRDLQRLLKPLGLWRQRSPIFTEIAKAVEKKHGALPESREGLEELFHVGNYIASVILTTFHGKAEPFVDVNMTRVVDRFFGPRTVVDIRHDPYLHSVAREIVKNKKESLELNWAVLDFAALVCKAGRPRCEICPMTARCSYFSRADHER